MNDSVENPGGDDVTILVQKKGAHCTMWNICGFKPNDDAQGLIICNE